MKLLAALLLAAPAPAVERVSLPVAPLVVGSLAEPGQPLVPRLAAHARALQVPDAGADPRRAPVALGLLALTDASRPLADRISGYALARVAAEPGLLEAAAAMRPELAGPLARLPQLMIPASPYRGGLSARLADVVRLAETARGIPAVGALFDGRRPAAELADAGVRGNALLVAGRKAPQLLWPRGKAVYEHPELAGAVLELAREPLAPDARPFEPLPWREAALERLAARGLAPRTFGRDVVFAKGLGPAPMRAVAIRERLWGRSLVGVLGERPITAQERASVKRVLLAVMEEGGSPWEVTYDHVTLGATLLRPEPQAYLSDPAGLAEAPFPASLREQAADEWLRHAENAGLVWREKANSGLAGMKY